MWWCRHEVPDAVAVAAVAAAQGPSQLAWIVRCGPEAAHSYQS
jgi:hypothetical protein